MDADRLRAIIGSVAVHLIVVVIVAFTMWERPKPPAVAVSQPIIQARAVDEATAMAPVRRREAEAQRKKEAAEQRRREAEAEKKRQAEAETKKREAEKVRKAAAEKKKAEVEKKRQAELKRKQEETKAEVEKKRLAEVQKKKDLEQKKQQQEDEAKRKQREEKLKQEIAAEDARMREDERRLNAQRMSGMVNQYLADITNKVQANWLRLPGMPQNFQCKVEVRQIPGGEVVGVRMIESSGDAALDRSVEAAVWKSSPLPRPAAAELFDREVVITFVPK